LPFLLLLWLARRMSYLREHACTALAGSALNLLLVTFGLFVLQARHKASPALVFLVLGFCSLCAGLMLFHRLQIGVDENKPCSVDWDDAFAENLRYGRRLLHATTVAWTQEWTGGLPASRTGRSFWKPFAPQRAKNGIATSSRGEHMALPNASRIGFRADFPA
jgi:hypothetical protein